MTDEEIIAKLQKQIDDGDLAQYGYRIVKCPRCGHPTKNMWSICPTCSYEDGYDELTADVILAALMKDPLVIAGRKIITCKKCKMPTIEGEECRYCYCKN